MISRDVGLLSGTTVWSDVWGFSHVCMIGNSFLRCATISVDPPGKHNALFISALTGIFRILPLVSTSPIDTKPCSTFKVQNKDTSAQHTGTQGKHDSRSLTDFFYF